MHLIEAVFILGHAWRHSFWPVEGFSLEHLFRQIHSAVLRIKYAAPPCQAALASRVAVLGSGLQASRASGSPEANQ
jgi:hypothetical protein